MNVEVLGKTLFFAVNKQKGKISFPSNGFCRAQARKKPNRYRESERAYLPVGRFSLSR
jgi:hypothetical protein